MKTTTVTYCAHGSVRGRCAHSHRTIVAAFACAQRDAASCARLGGGAYSDRTVARRDGHGLTEQEEREVEALTEEALFARD